LGDGELAGLVVGEGFDELFADTVGPEVDCDYDWDILVVLQPQAPL
jgi:hypothetical protein